MFARALLVLLLILNLGVALWWTTRSAPPPVPAPELPQGAEALRLVDEAPLATAAARAPADPDRTGATANAMETGVGAAATSPVPVACIAFGPFADAATAERARARLQPEVLRLALRDARESQSAARGWNVLLPGLPDRAAADAAAARLVEAGFSDHYLLPADETGRIAIALGRFGAEAAAERHRAALRAAGFEAVAEPIGGDGAVRYWIDAALGADADRDILRRDSGAAQAEPVDCETVPRTAG